jgi:hypothetical protein
MKAGSDDRHTGKEATAYSLSFFSKRVKSQSFTFLARLPEIKRVPVGEVRHVEDLHTGGERTDVSAGAGHLGKIGMTSRSATPAPGPGFDANG